MILYYTCNTHDPEIDELCREQLGKINLPIVSVSLNKEIPFGDVRLVAQGERSPLMMHKQILMALEKVPISDDEAVFLCESDVLYHPSHFVSPPLLDDFFVYNNNVWKMRWSDKFCFRTDDMRQVSGLVARRETLLDFYSRRVEQIERDGFNRHYEPGLKQTVGSSWVSSFQSEYPNICIRHDQNITKSKFSPDEFRNKEYARGWRESKPSDIPGWGEFLEALA